MAEVLWRFVKGDQYAEARTSSTHYGSELRIFIDGELSWSRTFLGEPDVAATAVIETAADKRQEFLEEGWTPA